MKRRSFLKHLSLATAGLALPASRVALAKAEITESTSPETKLDPALAKDWLARWEKNILDEEHNRYCDHELGEEIGWLISPFLNGCFYGYQATHDPKWVEHLHDWAEAWIRRGVQEPDGFIGWPKQGTGGLVAKDFLTDSLLGEAMGLRPLVLMAAEIQRTPALQAKFRPVAESWLRLAERTFEKWEARGCWRAVPEGGLWVVPDWGMDLQTGKWTDGYAQRATNGFSNPDNKQNHIARWTLALFDATQKPVYRQRAESWFRLMRSRMKPREDGKYFVWNYWDPAGPWDYRPDGSTRHWVGVHPNGGYYSADLEGIVDAFEHGLVFTPADIAKLVATNRDFMWNQRLDGARFQRIDGGQPDERWKNSPGLLWAALAPHDETLRKVFLANHNPASWGGLWATPWFLAREANGA